MRGSPESESLVVVLCLGPWAKGWAVHINSWGGGGGHMCVKYVPDGESMCQVSDVGCM